MKPRIVFWGATGQSKVLREFVDDLGYELVAVFDNNPDVPPPFPDVPLIYGNSGFLQWLTEQSGPRPACLVAIGGARGQDRCRIQDFLEAHGLAPIRAVHPSAYVARNAILASGCQILAHATLGAEARLGKAGIINTAASVDHECALGEGVHVGPGATLAGLVTVGDFAMIGAGAVILPRIHLGQGAVVGAGAVVTKPVPDHTVVFGNPARILRRHSTPPNHHEQP